MSTILDYMRKSPGEGDRPASTKILKPQLDSNMGKQIMQNMESVMKTLKRQSKHKKHHKKKAKAQQQVETETVAEPATVSDDEGEEESLATLKKTWLSARPARKATEAPKTPTTSSDPDKKNAFQMMMLNGSKGNIESPSAVSNDENQEKKTKSPEVGKRKLNSSHKEQVKRRKVRSGDGLAPSSAGVSPKSPAKKGGRKKKLFECYVETIEPKTTSPAVATPPKVIELVESTSEDTPTTSGVRPRRSCAANVTYKDEVSPVSTAAKKPVPPAKVITPSTKTPSTTKGTPKAVPSPIVVINVDEIADAPRTPTTSGQSKKLAPLFIKSMPKPTLDPKVREARQSFLMSDLPDKMRQDMEKKKQVQEEVNLRQLSLFPEVSHVSVGSTEPYSHSYDADKLFPVKESSQVTPPRQRTYSVLRMSVDSDQESGLIPALSPLKTEQQKKQFVRNIKTQGDRKFPSFKFYKFLSKLAEDKTERATSQFSDVFRPRDSNEFVFNLSAVAEVKDYLESFIMPADSGSAYETDDDCSNSMDSFVMVSRQTLVLYGDCSTGKTSAVYAIANELNYNVIEINASSKRNGSKVLQQLMEATQSHKVQATKAVASLSRKILRKMEREEKKMSIIFIEDVDVVFTEDNGFLAAITQLMTMTKRPIILTTNNRNAPTLKKTFDASQNFKFLRFRRPTAQHTEDCMTYLNLIGVTQGCHFDPDYLRHLFEEVCRRDLRHSLLQMNFITQTKQIPLRWTGETDRVDIPCCNLEENEVEGEDALVDLAWTMENLCVADRWNWNEDTQQEMRNHYREACLLGNSLLDSRCDGTFYQDVKHNLANSM